MKDKCKNEAGYDDECADDDALNWTCLLLACSFGTLKNIYECLSL